MVTASVPRYIYQGEFSAHHAMLSERPHADRSFAPGGLLWRPGEYIERVYYIEHGIAKTFFVNEDGFEKTIYFHGAGTVFPGCHQTQFGIELSLVTKALTPVDAMEFTIGEFHQAMMEHPELASSMIETYARYINVLIFETAHQEKNDALVKLCNLLYLLALDAGGEGGPARRIPLSQEELAELLGMNRVSVAKALGRLREEGSVSSHRGWTEIEDMELLLSHCSREVSL